MAYEIIKMRGITTICIYVSFNHLTHKSLFNFNLFLLSQSHTWSIGVLRRKNKIKKFMHVYFYSYWCANVVVVVVAVVVAKHQRFLRFSFTQPILSDDCLPSISLSMSYAFSEAAAAIASPKDLISLSLSLSSQRSSSQ